MINIIELKQIASNINILYIEDELSIQKTMSKYLRKFFSSVTTANNGLEGLDFYKKNKFDIIITDLSMPKMNGIDMISKIKEIDENQPIIITTAHGETSFLLSALKSHVDGYIIKPFDFEELNFELYKISQKIKQSKENEDYKTHLQEMINIQTKEMSDNYEKTIYSMIELIEQRDTYTAGHSKRVAYYCKLIAQEMNYSEDECIKIHQAAILHDVGKIETPDSILLNPKSLNDIEYKLIQEHVTVSYKLLNSIPMFKPLANIVYSHHERYDGTGYPNQLKGDEIDKLARIMILSDAFDAMTTNRIYKAKKTVSEAILELSELSKKQFHPEVVESAIIALKDIKIDENINQLPKTKLEEERFAYFYKDTLSHTYNQNYLDVILMSNSHNLVYKNMVIFSIKNFTYYNKQNGWTKGDVLLQEFAKILIEYFNKELIFRIFGDEYIVISEQEIELQKLIPKLNKLMKKNFLTYKFSRIDLDNHKIEKLIDIEKLKISKS